MAYIYKRQSDSVYRFQCRDEHGVIRDFQGFSNKRATETEATRIQDEVRRRKLGIVNHRDAKLQAAELKPIEKHLAEWRDSIIANGSSDVWADLAHYRVRIVFDLCNAGQGYTRISQLDPVEVQGVIKRLLDESVGQQTANHVVQSCKQFSKWLDENDRCAEHKLRRLKKYALTKIEHVRVNFGWPQIVQMIQHVEQEQPNRSGGQFIIPGPDRAMMYRVAVASGFRRRSLRSIMPESFCLEPNAATLTALPGYHKNKKAITVPLPESLAELIRKYLADKPAGIPLWQIPDHSARMLRRDFERAGVKFPDDEMARDFHCLRHTAISAWLDAGADLKTVQELAGHSSVILTQRYSHKTPDHKRKAVDAVPEIPSAAPE